GNGAKVAQFSIATSRKWTNNAGEQQEKTEWHRVVAWSKLADVVERYVKKGQQVYVEGEIQYRSYEDKDGVTKYSTEINARELMMLGGREGGGGFGGGDAGGGRERPAAAKPGGAGAQAGAANQGGGRDYDDFQPPAYGDEDDDLPF
ncbi:MAG: single-stranded DNA-binding protein, partial [Gemmatimonadetes bacterium]|nr:single-stranded DNA-binding protein [Gemmatimonadota bacterium]